MVGEHVKKAVLERLAAGRQISPLGKAKVRIGTAVVHVRFRARANRGGVVWLFNINPNTLTADYELWICGSPSIYYLVPKSTVSNIYDDPATYPDRSHREIKLANINSKTHWCAYGSGRGVDLGDFYGGRL